MTLNVQDKKPNNQLIKKAFKQVLSAAVPLRSKRMAKPIRHIVEQSLNNSNKTLISFDIASDYFNRAISENQNDNFTGDIASLKNHCDALAQLYTESVSRALDTSTQTIKTSLLHPELYLFSLSGSSCHLS